MLHWRTEHPEVRMRRVSIDVTLGDLTSRSEDAHCGNNYGLYFCNSLIWKKVAIAMEKETLEINSA